MKFDFTAYLKKTLLLIVILLLGLSIFTIVFVIFHTTKFNVKLNYLGISNWLGFFEPFKTLYASMFITLSAYVAIESLSNKKIIEEGKALLELRKLFNEVEIRKVNQNLRPVTGIWNNDNLTLGNGLREYWSEIDAYIELFELANKLIDKRVISLDSFREHFGYWLECLISNDNIRFKIKIEDRNWNSFKALCEKLDFELKPVINTTSNK